MRAFFYRISRSGTRGCKVGIVDRIVSLLSGKTSTPVTPLGGDTGEERRKRPRINAREGTRVLIIDDSRTTVATLRKYLASAGYEAYEAFDAESGLDMLRAHKPELVFLDIVLPGMNGFATLRAIRRNPAWHDTPVIMMSGDDQATEQFFGTRIGADDFMKKPFSRFEIFYRIERLLDEYLIPRRPTSSLQLLDEQPEHNS